MAEMRRIIVPTDFSEASIHAIHFILDAFQHLKFELHLLNVYTPAPISGRFMSSTDAVDLLNPLMEEASSSNLYELQTHLLKSYESSRLSIVTHSSFGLLNHAMTDLIEEVSPHLILTSSTKTSDLESFLLGNNTLSLIRNMEGIPLLVVPNQMKNATPKKIAVAVDLTRPISTPSLKQVFSFREQLKSSIEFVHVSEEPSVDKYDLINGLSASGKDFYEQYKDCLTIVPNEDSVTATLSRFLDKVSADVLVLFYHRNNLLYKLTHEPVVRRMLYKHEKAVYIIPEELD